VEEHELPPVWLEKADDLFQFDFELPAELVGKPAIQVTLTVDRVFVPAGEQRELGAVFGTFEIR